MRYFNTEHISNKARDFVDTIGFKNQQQDDKPQKEKLHRIRIWLNTKEEQEEDNNNNDNNNNNANINEPKKKSPYRTVPLRKHKKLRADFDVNNLPIGDAYYPYEISKPFYYINKLNSLDNEDKSFDNVNQFWISTKDSYKYIQNSVPRYALYEQYQNRENGFFQSFIPFQQDTLFPIDHNNIQPPIIHQKQDIEAQDQNQTEFQQEQNITKKQNFLKNSISMKRLTISNNILNFMKKFFYQNSLSSLHTLNFYLILGFIISFYLLKTIFQLRFAIEILTVILINATCLVFLVTHTSLMEEIFDEFFENLL